MKISLNSNGGTYKNVDMDYYVEIWKTLTYEISWVAHYTIDMVSDLTMDIALNFGIGYGLMLVVNVTLVGWLVHGIE